jgi:hypothetical protein
MISSGWTFRVFLLIICIHALPQTDEYPHHVYNIFNHFTFHIQALVQHLRLQEVSLIVTPTEER